MPYKHAAKQKEKYTSVENSDGTTTNTFEKKRKLGKNKGEVKKRVTSKVKKDESGETKGLASVTQKYDKKGELKKEKGFGEKKELASLRESVKNNNSIAAAQKKGTPAKPTSSISKASLILNPNKKVFKNIEAKNNYNYKLKKEGPYPDMAARMKGDYAAKMSDTDMGIKERYGKQATSDVFAAQQKGNPIMPNLYKDEHTDSGMNYRDANNVSIDGGAVDEENLSNIKTKSPYRPYVETTQTSEVPMRPNSAALPGGGEPGEKLFLDKVAKMHAKHPSMKRMSDMVTKVATYNMPNVKAAQKKYHK
jgi:hypothetical protein